MKLLMDSDCLIKLAKSGLKEIICKNFQITIPAIVKYETVEQGRGHPDAEIIDENIRKGLIRVKETPHTEKGEDAVYFLFQNEKYSAICSDDRKFIRRLKIFDVPYITPAVLIAVLLKKKKITRTTSLQMLEKIRPFISDEEYSIVRIFIDTWR
jgi:rRNA-processing protein FCF1